MWLFYIAYCEYITNQETLFCGFIDINTFDVVHFPSDTCEHMLIWNRGFLSKRSIPCILMLKTVFNSIIWTQNGLTWHVVGFKGTLNHRRFALCPRRIRLNNQIVRCCYNNRRNKHPRPYCMCMILLCNGRNSGANLSNVWYCRLVVFQIMPANQ